MVTATAVTFLELPQPWTVRAACKRMAMEHLGEQVMMCWVNDVTLAVFTVAGDDDEGDCDE